MSRYIIDKSKLIENINIVKNKAGVEVIGVVKGNGYGFGMKPHNIELMSIIIPFSNMPSCRNFNAKRN